MNYRVMGTDFIQIKKGFEEKSMKERGLPPKGLQETQVWMKI